MQLGNREFNPNLIDLLKDFFKVKISEEAGRIYLIPKKDNYTKEELNLIIYIIGDLKPDTIEETEKGILLLWD